MEKRSRIRWLLLLPLVCGAVTIVLMALPNGFPMTFARGPHQRYTRYYSYYSGMPMGYGNWFPIVSALFTLVALVLTVTALLRPQSVKRALFLAVCAAFSLLTGLLAILLFGETPTAVGMAVTALQATSVCAVGIYLLRMVLLRKAVSAK